MSTKQLEREQTDDRASADGRSADLNDSGMMRHLLDALKRGEDIQHYGRLVFVMIARYFLQEDELVGLLAKQPGVSEDDARGLLLQVKARDYSPPKRERIIQWQSQQEFPILPDPEDPDSGNVYSELRFPDQVYEHIQEYYEEKAEARAA